MITAYTPWGGSNQVMITVYIPWGGSNQFMITVYTPWGGSNQAVGCESNYNSCNLSESGETLKIRASQILPTFSYVAFSKQMIRLASDTCPTCLNWSPE